MRPRGRIRRRPRGWTVPEVGLSDDWRGWIVENALRGVEPAELVEGLVAGGVPRRLAAAEVVAVLRSPAWPGCVGAHRRAERLEMVLRLLRSSAARGPAPAEVDRRPTIGADELHERYLAASRPLVLTEVVRSWPAVGKWTPAYFEERFGDVEIEIMADRDAHPDPERNLDRHRRRITMAEYARKVTSAGVSNDAYLVSNNRAFELPGLAPLLQDLTPPPDVFESPVRPGDASLWFGPAGTVTPLHHDTTSILICQIHGRKRFDLVSPLSSRLVLGARGFFAGIRAPDLTDTEDGAPVMRVVLSPGEALLIPAGWWHEVTALDACIHVSLLSFRRRQSVDWYRPGEI